MRVYGFPALALVLVGVVHSAALQPRELLKDLHNQAIKALKAAEANNAHERKGGCSFSEAPIRQDWSVGFHS